MTFKPQEPENCSVFERDALRQMWDARCTRSRGIIPVEDSIVFDFLLQDMVNPPLQVEQIPVSLNLRKRPDWTSNSPIKPDPV